VQWSGRGEERQNYDISSGQLQSLPVFAFFSGPPTKGEKLWPSRDLAQQNARQVVRRSTTI